MKNKYHTGNTTHNLRKRCLQLLQTYTQSAQSIKERLIATSTTLNLVFIEGRKSYQFHTKIILSPGEEVIQIQKRLVHIDFFHQIAFNQFGVQTRPYCTQN